MTPRGHSVPDLVQIVLQIGLEGFDGLSVHSRCALVPLHLLEGFPDLPLRYIERLALRLQLVHQTPPRRIARLIEQTQPRTTLPLGSTPITGVSQLLRAGPPAFPATVLNPSRFRPLGTLPLSTSNLVPVSGNAFPRSAWKQQIRLALPLCRTPPGQSTGTRQTCPGIKKTPRF